MRLKFNQGSRTMKSNTPLSILTATFGLFFAHVSLSDDYKAPAKYYDRKDLPERSLKLDLPKKQERDTGINDITIDRDALLNDERQDDVLSLSHQSQTTHQPQR